jgi:hypothetical protein
MAAFPEDENAMLDWRQPDVFAIVGCHGLAAIDETVRSECLAWLEKHNYRVDRIDCSRGLAGFLEDVNRLFRWEKEFGYKMIVKNLDALNDGFQVEVPATGGAVLEFHRPDLLWEQEPEFLMGALQIASAHSLRHIACGRRFFNLMVVPPKSPFIGQVIPMVRVPSPAAFNAFFKEPEWRAGLREQFPKPKD